eukprot:7757294-Lingulodinium_polyedra.AAC.1
MVRGVQLDDTRDDHRAASWRGGGLPNTRRAPNAGLANCKTRLTVGLPAMAWLLRFGIRNLDARCNAKWQPGPTRRTAGQRNGPNVANIELPNHHARCQLLHGLARPGLDDLHAATPGVQQPVATRPEVAAGAAE